MVRRWLMPFLLALPLGCGKGAEEPAPAPPPPAVDGPRLTFVSLEHDFGVVPQWEQKQAVFEFENTGSKPLEIGEVKPSCGCTVVLLSDKVVPPGEKGRLSTTFNAGLLKGEIKKDILVRSNDPASPETKLWVSAKVKPEFLFEPAALLFNKVKKGERVEKTVEFRHAEGKPFEIKKTEVKEPGFETSFRQEGGSAKIPVSFAASGHSRLLTKPLMITVAWDGQQRIYVVPIRVQVVGDVSLEPPHAYFGSFDLGKKPFRKFQVVNHGGTPVEIEDIQTKGPDIFSHSTQVVEAGKKYEVTLWADKAGKPGRFHGKLLIKVSGQDAPLELLFAGNVR